MHVIASICVTHNSTVVFSKKLQVWCGVAIKIIYMVLVEHACIDVYTYIQLCLTLAIDQGKHQCCSIYIVYQQVTLL